MATGNARALPWISDAAARRFSARGQKCATFSSYAADERIRSDRKALMSNKPIRKAIFPVAGLGTRFLPATKAVAKELLPIVDRPLIQYAVDEAMEAGIEQMIFVTGRGKGAIEDHFDMAFELETTQAARGKDMSALDGTRLTPGNAVFVRQQETLGLGHAIWCARDLGGDEPFAILLPDEFMHGAPGCLRQ